MKEQIEKAVSRRKYVSGDIDEARKTATGHSCKPLPFKMTNGRERLMELFILKNNK